MEIGVRKEYVITTKGTPLHNHCQVREGAGKEGLEEGRGGSWQKEECQSSGSCVYYRGAWCSSDEKPSCVRWISKFYIPSLSLIWRGIKLSHSSMFHCTGIYNFSGINIFAGGGGESFVFVFNSTSLTRRSLKNSVALVRTRTIPTERPPPFSEVSANFCG